MLTRAPFTRRQLWARRFIVAVAVALGLGYLPYQLYRRSDWAHYFRLRAELTALQQTNRRLYEENTRLRAELNTFPQATDGEGLPSAVVERIARDELGLVRPGEVVFQVEAQTQ